MCFDFSWSQVSNEFLRLGLPGGVAKSRLHSVVLTFINVDDIPLIWDCVAPAACAWPLSLRVNWDGTMTENLGKRWMAEGGLRAAQRGCLVDSVCPALFEDSQKIFAQVEENRLGVKLGMLAFSGAAGPSVSVVDNNVVKEDAVGGCGVREVVRRLSRKVFCKGLSAEAPATPAAPARR